MNQKLALALALAACCGCSFSPSSAAAQAGGGPAACSAAQACSTPAGAVCALGTCLPVATAGGAAAGAWPVWGAQWELRLHSTNQVEPPCPAGGCTRASVVLGGPDDQWAHLHRGSTNAPTATLTTSVVDGDSTKSNVDDIELRYTARGGTAILSPWIRGSSDPTFAFTLDVADGACCGAQGDLDTLLPEDGVFDLSVEVRVYNSEQLEDFKPYPIFLHLNRQNQGFPTSDAVPLGLDEPDFPDDGGATRSFTAPSLAYMSSADIRFRGYPADPNVDPWDADALTADLIVEPLTAGVSSLFENLPMWWADPAHTTPAFPDGLPFVRGFPPKHAEAITGDLRVRRRHERFPVKDGPRGVGWMSSYVGGAVDSCGRFVFAETSGRVAILYPDGEIFTLAGHVTTPGKHPIWYKKTTATVRQNQELRGTWTSTQQGFHMPTDVALDPLADSTVMYVAGYEDNVIWKIEIGAGGAGHEQLMCGTHDVTVSIFAGQTDHSRGTADGTGTQASFSGPSSLVFDPVRDVIYVADQDSSRIRQITRAGVVTTLFGGNNVQLRGGGFGSETWGPPSVQSACADWWLQECAKPAANLEGSSNPDIFVPHAIRVDSLGNIILLEHGFGTIRQINPVTGATTVLGRVDMKHTEWDRGWAWMDVDRWGTLGETDSVYWVKSVGEVFGASHGPNRGDPGCTSMYKNIDCSTSPCSNQGDYACATSTNMFSESYGFIPPNNNDQKSHLLFNTDRGQLPNFYFDARRTDPAHYPWLVAVDPRGALLLGGLGQHGIRRMRMRKTSDVVSAEQTSTSWDHFYNYWQGRRAFARAADETYGFSGTPAQTVSMSAKYGQDGHNILGTNDTWALGTSATDAEIIAALEFTPDILADTGIRDQVLHYLRANMGSANPVPSSAYTPPGIGQAPAYCAATPLTYPSGPPNLSCNLPPGSPRPPPGPAPSPSSPSGSGSGSGSGSNGPDDASAVSEASRDAATGLAALSLLAATAAAMQQ